MRMLHIVFVLGLFIFSNGISFAQTAKTPQYLKDIPPLEREVRKFYADWNSTEIRTVVMDSLHTTRMPGGFASLFYENKEPRYSFQLKSLILKDVLDAIVEKEPRYEWKMENGVVNVLPKEKIALLETHVANFQLENATKEKMFSALISKPEFQGAVINANLERDIYRCCGGLCTTTPQRNSINLENATVREILNEIVRLNGFSSWEYREFSDKAEDGKSRRYYKLSFLVDFGAECGGEQF